MAIVQMFLGADAAFGIRLVVAETGRKFFHQQGWYGHRWTVQAILFAAACMIILTAWVILRRARNLPSGGRLALGGTLLSGLLFLIAAISMHRLEVVLAWPFEPLALGTSVRAAACGLTAAGAWRYLQGGKVAAI